MSRQRIRKNRWFHLSKATQDRVVLEIQRDVSADAVSVRPA